MMTANEAADQLGVKLGTLVRLRQPRMAEKLPSQSRPPGAVSARRYRGAARCRLHRARTPRTQPAGRIDVGHRRATQEHRRRRAAALSSPSRPSARSTRASSRIADIRSRRSSRTRRSRKSASCSGAASARSPRKLPRCAPRFTARRCPASVAEALAAVGDDAPPLLRLEAVMPSLAAWDRRQPPRTRIDRAKLIISQLPLALAQPPAAWRTRRSWHGRAPARMGSRLDRLRMGSRGARSRADRMRRARAQRLDLRRARRSRARAPTSLPRCSSALCSLCGPIHGGACDRIESMFAELESGARVDECLAAFTRDHRLPPGFGHAIYPDGDPRAALLKQVAQTIAKRRGRRLFETALKVEDACGETRPPAPESRFLSDRVRADAGLSAIDARRDFRHRPRLGMDRARLEQYADNRLIRPRMRYRGAPLRHWE